MFANLPNELIIQVAQYLNHPTDIFGLLMTSKHMSILVQPLLQKEVERKKKIAKIAKMPLLHLAVYENDRPFAKLALKENPLLINTSIDRLGTPLTIASCRANPRMVQFLIDNGSDLNEASHYLFTTNTPLNHVLHIIRKFESTNLSLLNRRKHVIKLLLDAGADPSIRDRVKYSALDIAVVIGFPKIIAHIMQTGFMDINSRSRLQKTALHIAVQSSKTKTNAIIRELLKHGSDVNAVDSFGMPPFFYCRTASSASLLLKAGYNIKIVDQWQQSALHRFACKANATLAAKVVYEILQSEIEVDISLLDRDGRTALDCATETGHGHVVEMLEKYKEKQNKSLDKFVSVQSRQ